MIVLRNVLFQQCTHCKNKYTENKKADMQERKARLFKPVTHLLEIDGWLNLISSQLIYLHCQRPLFLKFRAQLPLQILRIIKLKKGCDGFHTINCHRHWCWTSLGSSSYCLYCSTYYYYVSCHHLSALPRMIPCEDDSAHLSDHMTSCPWGRSKLSAVYWASLHFQIDTAEWSSG